MSATHRWLMSSEHTMSGPGGNSTTKGPSARSSSSGPYGVSELAVNTSCSGPQSKMPKTLLGTIPAAALPLMMAAPDTVG